MLVIIIMVRGGSSPAMHGMEKQVNAHHRHRHCGLISDGIRYQ
jgi:hypothetical protein